MSPIIKPASRGKKPECLLTSLFGRQSIDSAIEDFDDQIEVDRADFNPPSRLKDDDLARTLAILDELEMKGGKA